MEYKPNFSKAYVKANKYLATSHNISTFPYSPRKLVKETGNGLIVCRTFEKAKEYDVDVKALGSDSATLTKYHGKHIIFYDNEKSISHVKFSILHEYGHYILNHNLNCKDKELYGIYEVEANFFAAQLLMPDQIVREFMRRGQNITCEFLEKTFDVSQEAAEKRLETFRKTIPEFRNSSETEFDDIIRTKYIHLINSICPKYDTYDFEDDLEMENQRNQWYY